MEIKIRELKEAKCAKCEKFSHEGYVIVSESRKVFVCRECTIGNRDGVDSWIMSLTDSVNTYNAKVEELNKLGLQFKSMEVVKFDYKEFNTEE